MKYSGMHLLQRKRGAKFAEYWGGLTQQGKWTGHPKIIINASFLDYQQGLNLLLSAEESMGNNQLLGATRCAAWPITMGIQQDREARPAVLLNPLCWILEILSLLESKSRNHQTIEFSYLSPKQWINSIFISPRRLGAGCLRELVPTEIHEAALGRNRPQSCASVTRGLHRSSRWSQWFPSSPGRLKHRFTDLQHQGNL